jgi:hypothetical protein
MKKRHKKTRVQNKNCESRCTKMIMNHKETRSMENISGTKRVGFRMLKHLKWKKVTA